ncbi:Macrophage mannose receptor 1 [Anabarilius grahami]|uniref:Macrophage mannose receptor 1 n=1 Tax=Anabarilius grahami TaxID=495550 RepID=A0A3N0XSJ3_ANAGA|nr:Macrophage mannose receptor 1 [Anabarilius grahami]
MDNVNRLVNIVDTGYSGSVWIGLKRGTQTRWAWSNGEDMTSHYSNWASSQPNGDGDCVSTHSGVWHMMACDSLRYFVCQNENNGYIMVQSNKTWSDAQSYCREYYTDLPSIHNSEENNQITNVLLAGHHIWFGLFLDSWEWSDKWSRFFRNWAAGQPSQSSGCDCVCMSTTDYGEWAHESCDLKRPFICYSARYSIIHCINKVHTANLTLKMDLYKVFVMQHIRSWLFWSSSALSRQYHYINVRMSWPEAQSYCREKYTDLATVDTMDDVNRLVNIVDAGYSGSVWIGLKRGTQKRWVWSNGEDTLTQYSAWNKKEPSSHKECGYFAFGVWYSYPCSSYLHFVCYSEREYIRLQTWKNWTDAQSYCRQHHIDLPTIHNSEEQNKIENIIPSGSWVWIGLFLDSWEWSDLWNRSFRYWTEGQPSQSSGSDCVGMSRTNSGKWAHESCDLKRPFICHGGEFPQLTESNDSNKRLKQILQTT